jgi:hypothetical protein
MCCHEVPRVDFSPICHLQAQHQQAGLEQQALFCCCCCSSSQNQQQQLDILLPSTCACLAEAIVNLPHACCLACLPCREIFKRAEQYVKEYRQQVCMRIQHSSCS